MNIALILAGGNGSRMGQPTPKQFLSLCGKPVLMRTVEAFVFHPEIDAVCLVSGEEWSGRVKYLTEGYDKICGVTDGGRTRRESAFRGLTFLMERYSPDDIVLIHDAARPLVSARVISDSIRCLTRGEWKACTAAIPVQDTVLESGDGQSVTSVLERNRLFAVQTPQTFRLGTIYEGHRTLPPEREVTDDAGILTSQGIPVGLVAGEKRNLKITSPEDMAVAECYLTVDRQ